MSIHKDSWESKEHSEDMGNFQYEFNMKIYFSNFPMFSEAKPLEYDAILGFVFTCQSHLVSNI